MTLQFLIEIDNQTVTTRSYEDFINKLRGRLQDGSIRNRPILVPQQSPPTQFFNVIVRNERHSVRFRLRRDNLYLLGYQVDDGQWLEFRNSNGEHLITEPATEFLPFDGSYLQVLRSAGHDQLGFINIGLRGLENRLDEFATTTSPNWNTRAQYLIRVIIMICEATRFTAISNDIATNPSEDYTVPVWMAQLIRNWESFSAAVFRGTANPEVSFPDNIIRLPDGRGIGTVTGALEVLGILLACMIDSGPRRFPRMAIDEGQCFSEIPLVEVFSVRINDIDGENPGQLYGTITIDNGLYPQYIYNRSSSNYESVRPGQYASLTGPSEPISAFGSVTMKLLLTDHNTIFPDVGIANEEIFLRNAYDISGYLYDQAQQLHTSNGSVTVNYAVLRNAMAARVIVTLKEASSTRTNQVYGQISAHYDNWNDPDTTCSLFNRAYSEYVNVNRGQDIPLLRSVIAVPLNSSLKVTARLHYPIIHDELRKRSVISYDENAEDTVVFPVPEKIPHTMSHEIKGEREYSVLVTVMWSSGF